MFEIIGWIVFGLIVGVIAKLVLPGRDPGGLIVTMIIGIAGAIAGGWLGRAMGLYGSQQSAGFFMALLGAVGLLVLYRFLRTTPSGSA
ncbi:MAG: GlsB/YeaQ/YmgE family stress response membrane protein [Bryobacteraceae bacterium]